MLAIEFRMPPSPTIADPHHRHPTIPLNPSIVFDAHGSRSSRRTSNTHRPRRTTIRVDGLAPIGFLEQVSPTNDAHAPHTAIPCPTQCSSIQAPCRPALPRAPVCYSFSRRSPLWLIMLTKHCSLLPASTPRVHHASSASVHRRPSMRPSVRAPHPPTHRPSTVHLPFPASVPDSKANEHRQGLGLSRSQAAGRTGVRRAAYFSRITISLVVRYRRRVYVSSRSRLSHTSVRPSSRSTT